MRTETIDFREFVRNEHAPKPGTADVQTNSVFATGYVIIGLTCAFGLATAAAENIAARHGKEMLAQGIVSFMRVFMPATLLAALALLFWLNPLL